MVGKPESWGLRCQEDTPSGQAHGCFGECRQGSYCFPASRTYEATGYTVHDVWCTSNFTTFELDPAPAQPDFAQEVYIDLPSGSQSGNMAMDVLLIGRDGRLFESDSIFLGHEDANNDFLVGPWCEKCSRQSVSNWPPGTRKLFGILGSPASGHGGLTVAAAFYVY